MGQRAVRLLMGRGREGSPRERICEICESGDATERCRLCGREVCDSCFISEDGICVVCLEAMCEECGKSLAVDACVICGRNVCRGCSVELDYARRICLSCSRRVEDPRGYIEREARERALRISAHWSELL